MVSSVLNKRCVVKKGTCSTVACHETRPEPKISPQMTKLIIL